MDATRQKMLQALEAVLFIYGEAIALEKLAHILKKDKSEVSELIDALQNELGADSRGLMLMRTASSVQLVTKPALASFLEDLTKEEFNEELTKAALETLSIVAYLGPVTRAEIDYMRGVNSSFILRSLLLRKLVDREPMPERPGVMRYEISFDALRHLGMANVRDLPDFGKYRELLKLIRKDGQ